MGRLPFLKFYPADWFGDPGVRTASLATRAVWFELLLLMHDSPQRGVLLIGPPPGRQPTMAELALILGAPRRQVARSFREIFERGIASKSASGAMVSRKMLRENELSSNRRGAAAARWGKPLSDPERNNAESPILSGGFAYANSMQVHMQSARTLACGQRPEARIQNPEQAAALPRLIERVLEHVGIDAAAAARILKGGERGERRAWAILERLIVDTQAGRPHEAGWIVAAARDGYRVDERTLTDAQVAEALGVDPSPVAQLGGADVPPDHGKSNGAADPCENRASGERVRSRK